MNRETGFLREEAKSGSFPSMRYAPSTVDAIWLAKVRQARAMTEEQRVLAGPRLFAGVCERMKEGLREENPGVDEAGIHRLLLGMLKRIGKLERNAPVP